MSNVVPIRPVLPKSLTRAEAAALIQQVLQDSANLRWKDHVFTRMRERDVTDMQVLQVLRRGEVTRDPKFGEERNWEVTMEAVTAGDLVRVGAAIDVDSMGLLIVVITVVVL